MCTAKEQGKDDYLQPTAVKISESWWQHFLEDVEVYNIVKKAFPYSLK